MSPSTRTDAGCEGFAGCGEGVRKEKGVRLWRKHEECPRLLEESRDLLEEGMKVRGG